MAWVPFTSDGARVARVCACVCVLWVGNGCCGLECGAWLASLNIHIEGENTMSLAMARGMHGGV